MRRSYQYRKLERHTRKPAELLLVPMIDIFTVLVTFLLMTAGSFWWIGAIVASRRAARRALPAGIASPSWSAPAWPGPRPPAGSWQPPPPASRNGVDTHRVQFSPADYPVDYPTEPEGRGSSGDASI